MGVVGENLTEFLSLDNLRFIASVGGFFFPREVPVHLLSMSNQPAEENTEERNGVYLMRPQNCILYQLRF